MSSMKRNEKNPRRGWLLAGSRCLLVAMIFGLVGLGAGHGLGITTPVGNQSITAAT